MIHEILQIPPSLRCLGNLRHLQVLASEEFNVARHVEMNEGILETGLAAHVEVALYHHRALNVIAIEMRFIFHEVIFPVKVVVYEREVPWFWPETEV